MPNSGENKIGSQWELVLNIKILLIVVSHKLLKSKLAAFITRMGFLSSGACRMVAVLALGLHIGIVHGSFPSRDIKHCADWFMSI